MPGLGGLPVVLVAGAAEGGGGGAARWPCVPHAPTCLGAGCGGLSAQGGLGVVRRLQGVSGQRVSLHRNKHPCAACLPARCARRYPPSPARGRRGPSRRGSGVTVQSACLCPAFPRVRAAKGGRVCPGSGGGCPLGEHLGSLGCALLPLPCGSAIRGSVHQALGHCLGLLPWVPLSPAPPLL